MQLRLEYDYAALFIFLILLIFYYYRNHLPLLQNRFFVALTWIAMAATVFDIAYGIFQNMSDAQRILVPKWIVWTVNECYYIANMTITPLFTMYASALVDFFDTSSENDKRTFRLLQVTPYVVSIVVLLLNPIMSHWGVTLAFTINDVNYYERGHVCFIVLYMITLYYILLAFTLIHKYRKTLQKGKKIILLSFVFFAFAGAIMQWLFPEMLVQCFSVAIAVMVFSYNIEQTSEMIDSITNLYNQSAFNMITVRQFRQGKKFTVIGVLIDDIFFLSTTYSQEYLDKINHEIGIFLKKEFPHAHIYHLTAGQFCLVFEDTDPRMIEKAVFQIRTRFHQQWNAQDSKILLYSRLCVIGCPEEAQNTAEISDILHLVANDERYKSALIYAKNIDIAYRRRTITLEHVLKNALSDNKFEVYYQPIYSTGKRRLIGAEALIRLRDGEGNFISPEEFIPIAEKTGVILRAGEFVFDTVCRMLAQVNLERYGIEKLDVNLSVTQCMQEILAEQIISIQEIYQIPSRVLDFEITETATAYTPEILLKNMQALTEHGSELSLDDYGSGYSNMNYMLNLPFKMIKLDKEIVWKAFTNNKASIALASTIQMIKALGMLVLAEGIETSEQADWLTRLGVDYLQGFYYGRPLPQEDFLELMKISTEEYYKVNGLTFSDEALAVNKPHTDDLEELEELEEAEEFEEIDELEDVEELDDAEEPDDLEELSEPDDDEPAELEEID